MTRAAHVVLAPAKPLMIYDGECNFCQFWIARWRRGTEGRVEYIASQDARVAAQFPELPRERFAESVQLIETNGQVYSGAEAVFRSLTYGRHGRWLLWMYQNIPGVHAVTEWMYRFVARHREWFSYLTRLVFGEF